VGRVERPADDLVLLGDNLDVLPRFADESFQLVYADPPFNTGGKVTRRTLEVVPDEVGDRVDFKGRRYASRLLRESSYPDSFEDYLGFLEPRIRELRRLLSPSGTLYLHLDYREAHYAKLLLDELFGRECFLNEIVWAYDYGAKPKRRWPAKHDTILVYVKDPHRYWFDSEAVEREPYMAPGLVTAEKPLAASCRYLVVTIAHTEGEDRLPDAKPEGILRRSSSLEPAGRLVPDPFAGSGTPGRSRRLSRASVRHQPERQVVAWERLARST
jgi:site-specific DNA-methyltransferase (adenine-specific)